MSGTGAEWVDVLCVTVGEGELEYENPVPAIVPDLEVSDATSVEAAESVLTDREIGALVVDGEPDAMSEALDALGAAVGDAMTLAVVEGSTDEAVDTLLDAGADDLVPRPSNPSSSTGTAAIARNRIGTAVSRRKTARRASLTDESRDALLEQASIPVLLISKDRRVVHATDGAIEYLEYDSLEDIVGQHARDIVAPEDHDRTAERLERVLDRKESVPEAELQLQTADGDDRYAAVTTTRGHYDGEVVAQAIARDVTERYDPIGALAHHESILPSALNVLEDLIFVVDNEGQVRFWNERVREALGYDDDEISEIEPTAFFPPEHREIAESAMSEVFETGSSTLEAPVETKSGEQVLCEFRARAVENEAGEVVGLVGVGRDVSERRRRERSLRTLNEVATDLKTCETATEASERTVEAATSALDLEFCDLSLVDDAGEFLVVEATSEALPGDAAMRMSVEDGIAGKTYRTQESFLVGNLLSHEDADPQGEFESLISVPVGEYGVFQAVHSDPDFFDETDLELAELLVGHCATALSRIEREETLRERTASLEAQNERLEEFASVVSHDLRNPLTLLQAELEVAEETGEPESFDRVRGAIDRMDALIDDLLSLARAGEDISSTEAVDVENAVVQCWGTVSTSDATVEMEELPSVQADPTRLRQLLENLFRNAVEHGPGDGEDAITVTVGSLDDAPGFFVADDGVGIPEDEREAIFESGYSTATDGTGFGLRIVEDVATAHGWEIAVTESEAGGARFEIRT
jgi:PAS domain S-box-containing protein